MPMIGHDDRIVKLRIWRLGIYNVIDGPKTMKSALYQLRSVTGKFTSLYHFPQTQKLESMPQSGGSLSQSTQWWIKGDMER